MPPKINAILHKLPTPDFASIRAMLPEQAAKPITDLLTACESMDRQIESLKRQTFAVRGAALQIAQEKRVWEYITDPEMGVPFKSCNRWLNVMFPNSRTWKDDLAILAKIPEVPFEELLTMSRANAVTLGYVSSNLRALPDVLEAAQTLSEDAFAAKLTKEHNQCLERSVTLKMTYPAGDADQVKTFLGWVAGKADLAPDDYAGALLYLAIDQNQEHSG
jgi:hypothetical protein